MKKLTMELARFIHEVVLARSHLEGISPVTAHAAEAVVTW